MTRSPPDPHSLATPPRGTVPPDAAPHGPTGAPFIGRPEDLRRHESFSGLNVVDREWAELEVATRPPPAGFHSGEAAFIMPKDRPPPRMHDELAIELDDARGARPLAHDEPAPFARDELELEHGGASPTMPKELAPRHAELELEHSAPTVRRPSLAALAEDDAPRPREQEMRDRVALGDYSGALEIAQAILADTPGDPEARSCAEECRSALRDLYAARVGPLDRVPTVAVPREQLRWLAIDHKAGFVLSLIDGVSSLEMIIDVSGMPELDTLRILSELAQQRIISLS